MKDYLKDNLSKNEKAFVRGIIRNASLHFLKDYLKVQEREVMSLDDIDNKENKNAFERKFLSFYDNYNFIDKILETEILRDISALTPYTQYEKEKIVKLVDNLAYEAGLEKFIAPLTFEEKLVVFFVYIVEYQINEVVVLLNMGRSSIWRYDNSLKDKISKVKEELKK